MVDRAIKFIFRSAALYFVIGLTNVLAYGFMCSCKKQNDQLLAVQAEPEPKLEANQALPVTQTSTALPGQKVSAKSSVTSTAPSKNKNSGSKKQN